MTKQVIVLEFTPNQCVHFVRLAKQISENGDISIKDLQFPREFREVFENTLFRKESPVQEKLFESVKIGHTDRIKPTDFMLAVHSFHKKKF